MRARAKGRRLLPRVRANGRVLRDAYRIIARAIGDERVITPAAEWLVDNFHVVDEQLREIRDDLPPRFYRELPKVAEGPLEGYPRVYGLAWAFVAHTDSRLDPEILRRFVRAYQRVQPLTIGELWAVAITLRMVLVENLRRLAEAIVRGRAAHQEADALADDVLGLDGRAVDPAVRGLQWVSDAPLATAFAVQFAQRLREQDPAVTPALEWLDQRLAAQGTTADEVVRVEHQRQAAMNVTVRNVIMSMSLMSTLNWSAFFESVSLVDEVLRASDTYLSSDFTTRDAFRHVIEDLARGSGRAELDVAREALLHAHRAQVMQVELEHAEAQDARRHEAGYYLVGNGRPELERALGFVARRTRRLRRAYVAAALPGYLGSIAVLTGVILALPLAHAAAAGMAPALLAVLALVALIPASDLAIALVNRSVASVLPPRVLPRLELRDGAPPALRTMIVVPTLLTRPLEAVEQVERLEVHYLANPDGDLLFALLSDWTDAPTEHLPGDDDSLASAREAIAGLNRRHGPAPGGGERFLLFHRRRLWSDGEGVWMGWERKRGKLHELNRLLRGATNTSFIAVDAAVVASLDVRYVITLDADTQLPREAADQLIATMGHPLNRPRLDATQGRVVEGYAVLQPRVTPPLPGGESSRFQRLSSGPAGIDPYAAAVSDVYQDLFGEGSYTGKGIYDVDAFEAALAGRAPENALLSHDLFEGIFARAGLVTDVELFEHAPSHYGVAAARQHRWARGDWQLLPWIVGRHARTVPILGQWKMLDNLRRTLSAPSTFLTLVAGWTLPGASPGVWTAFVLAMIALPMLPAVVTGAIPRRQGISKRSHVRAVGRDILHAAAQVAFVATMVAHQAWLMSDAIARSLGRMYVTHRRRLEWVPAAQAKSGLDLRGFYRRMGGGVVLAAAAAGAVAWQGRPAWPVALAWLLLWAASPALARWISLPAPGAGAAPLSTADARTLRLIARRTWQFFATFVGSEDHALPPDNFQEDPRPVIAHRTSPTNIGLYLLSTVAAHDFGWIGTLDALERLEATFTAMAGLERVHGHFYNWYDTRDGRPLDPRYVSSVDSGNLAGHLIAFAHACREMIDAPRPGPAALAGIDDTALLVRESVRALAGDPRHATTRGRLGRALDIVAAALETAPATPAAWATRLAELDAGTRMVAAIARALVEEAGAPAQTVLGWSEALRTCVEGHARDLAVAPADAVADRLTRLAERARAWAEEMEFAFLFDPMRKLFSLGYRVSEGTLDPGCYDLLASEARLMSFVAVAKGDVPVAHWFRLGRALTPVDRDSVLMSWSGSMFEYLMPALVMRAPVGSLLAQTAELAVRRQIRYGAEREVPWGVSESAYFVRDREMTYQYSDFGVPGLGLKRGLSQDVVVAPYATGLGAMIEPTAAARNFQRLVEAGACGAYGFYDALDYTPARLPVGTRVAIVRTYMAHHQGMLLVALANALQHGRMRARFHAEPVVQATELLLQERTPRAVAVARPEEVVGSADVQQFGPAVVRRFASPHSATPRTHLLSNGRYAVMLTAAGSGYSRCRDLAITRWREDVTCDVGGTYVFLRDVQSGDVWSAGYQPSGREPESYEVRFAEDRAEIIRHDHGISTTLEVIVSPEDDAEIHRVSLTNLGTRPREIEVTSYAEVVLTTPAADAAHPAFSNLFVHTEIVPEVDALLATRRARSHEEVPVWLAHVVSVEGASMGRLQWETDREKFLGRGRGIRAAAAVAGGGSLSNTVGSVLDPIVSLRRRVWLLPGSTARVAFSTLVAPSRDEARGLADKYHDPATFERAVTLAWTHAQVQLHHLAIDPEEAHLFQSLASRILYSDRALRPAADVLSRHTGGPPHLWAHGISGDLPIVLVRIDEPEDVSIVRQLLRAHEYWRMKQLAVDLVIVNERAPSYVQDLQTLLETVVRASQSAPPGEPARGGEPAGHGRVFIVRADRLTPPQRDVLLSAARAVFLSRRGTLAEQVVRAQRSETAMAPAPRRRRVLKEPVQVQRVPPSLELGNGLGGFAEDGREYVTILGPGQRSPAPWINVIANPAFGFQVSESGAGYAWSRNSRERQLTPWSNDPVSDPSGEAIYVRDEETGEVWGPTALPVREESGSYVARHGQGYSRFERAGHGISLDLVQFVPLEDPVKISRLGMTNTSDRRRRLSVTAYVEWALGVSRSAGAPFVVTEIDGGTGAMLARNTWSADFGTRVAFADLGGKQTAWTADRTEFLGRHGTADRPAALERRDRLSGRVGAGLDPCAALQTTIELAVGERAEIVFFLGDAPSREAAAELIVRYRAADLAAVLRAVGSYWDDVLGTVQVRTPDRAMDLLLNRWLLYQTIACRLWARSAFYQAGGAYGFRDQLQDVMAVTVARPELTRAHILRAAARQFAEGDVQHWWHPQSGRGVRTRISDDLLWLPYVVSHYLAVTDDVSVLEELVPFLDGALVPAGESESYFEPLVSQETATLFEHCARAVDRSLAVGSHGLPLMGAGDWNDGMNRVGVAGKGESVWLGWFLHTILVTWADLADGHGALRHGRDPERAKAWRLHAGALGASLARDGWDGEWYRRAYFDDGTPLGSVLNDVCRIDSIAQSWSVLSGAAGADRGRRAMAAVDQHLVRRREGLVLVFTPPFDDTTLDPGYIEGYPPGVRENGGQYTHAALWSVMAWAALGDGDRASEVFAMLNPINHARTADGIARYRVEPYVVAADVYGEPPHAGRGGWTWYTGSAGWMYRAGLESILGCRWRGTHLVLDPCIPRDWPGFTVTFRHRSARYRIVVENPQRVNRGIASLELDDVPLADRPASIPLVDDARSHTVRLVLGAPSFTRLERSRVMYER